MILLALAAVALILFAGKSTTISGAGVSGAGITPIPTSAPTPLASASPQTPVISNATGGSLSATLGSAPAPPNYYATGNPGYDTQTKPVVSARLSTRIERSGIPFSKFEDILPRRAIVDSTVKRGQINLPVKSAVNPQGTFKPIIAARPVVIRRNGPEVAAAPWSRLPLKKVSK